MKSTVYMYIQTHVNTTHTPTGMYVCTYVQKKLVKTNYKGPTKSVLVIGCSSYQDLLSMCNQIMLKNCFVLSRNLF